jgi:hypothetical protein
MKSLFRLKRGVHPNHNVHNTTMLNVCFQCNILRWVSTVKIERKVHRIATSTYLRIALCRVSHIHAFIPTHQQPCIFDLIKSCYAISKWSEKCSNSRADLGGLSLLFSDFGVATISARGRSHTIYSPQYYFVAPLSKTLDPPLKLKHSKAWISGADDYCPIADTVCPGGCRWGHPGHYYSPTSGMALVACG